MQFEFFNQNLPQALIDIEDIGNCAIEASTEEGMFYYIVIRTNLGITTQCTCGPVVPDVMHLPTGYSSSLTRYDYKESKIAGSINSFLNNTVYNKKHISEAKVISVEEALNQFRDLQEYMNNYGEDVY